MTTLMPINFFATKKSAEEIENDEKVKALYREWIMLDDKPEGTDRVSFWKFVESKY